MATKSENADIAVLQTEMKTVNETLGKIDSKLTVMDEKLDVANSLEKRVTTLEKARAKNWIFNTLSAIAGAVLLYLIQYVLTHP